MADYSEKAISAARRQKEADESRRAMWASRGFTKLSGEFQTLVCSNCGCKVSEGLWQTHNRSLHEE